MITIPERSAGHLRGGLTTPSGFGENVRTDLLYRIFFHPHRLSPEFPMEVTLSPDLLRKQGRKLRIQ